MSENKYLLNPHATSFVPSSKSDVIREMAAKSLTELWEKKKANGETTVTNEEIAQLVGHFISIGFKDLTKSDKIKIQNYLNKKLLSSKIPAVRPISDLCKIRSKLTMKRTKPELFNLSKVETPNVSFLLVSFWGLHRHERAQRPLLSLTHRPDVMKDKIWSVDVSDYKLWNPSSISKACECPPVFGYSIPSNFFGVSFYLYSCSEERIHLNHYPESIEGDETITNSWHPILGDEQPFEDIIVDTNNGADVDTLISQFQTIVFGICDTLIKFEQELDCGIEENEMDEIDYYSSLWDDGPNISFVPFSEQNRETLFDDNDHPLLEMSKTCLAQNYLNANEVSSEIKEMIRKSLSPKKDNPVAPVTDEEKEVCDPPCSIWCDSVKKENSFEDLVSILSKSAENPKNSEDAPLIDLVSFDQLDSKEKVESINLTLKPAPTFLANKMKSNQSFLSFGGWDDYYYETNLDNGVTAYASNLTTSKNKFAFMRKDSVSSKLYRSESWDDYDSGFVSYSSSDDDVFDEIYKKDSMWKLVNSEDSLWKPLPECIDTNNKVSFPHKRIQDFRCRRSVT